MVTTCGYLSQSAFRYIDYLLGGPYNKNMWIYHKNKKRRDKYGKEIRGGRIFQP